MSRDGWKRALAGSVAALALAGGTFATMHPTQAATPVAMVEPAVAPIAGFADLVEKVKPAVVNISTTQKVERPRKNMPDMPFPPGSPYDEFFRRFFQDEQARRGPSQRNALGSGFIVDAAGYVVTNNHVIGDADEITVTLNDGTEYPATIKGKDPKTDLALLKIEARQPLPNVTFADGDGGRVGDWVIAVGNPFGLGGSVTAGIISARGRDINSGPYDDYLQIDAAINSGNSGGPTFNLAGQVIGVNAAIFSPNGGSVGIGFAIPASLARQVIADLRDSGKVARGWLGVEIQKVTPDIAQSLNIDKPKGALVSSLRSDSPAAAAGLKPGDLIVGFNGKPVADVHQLPREVASVKAGQAVEVELLRDGKSLRLPVTIAAMPEDQKVAAAEPARDTGKLGMTLATLTAESRSALGLSKDAQGVVVQEVDNQSVAGLKGIQAGDIITSVDQKPVVSPSEVSGLIQKAMTDKRKSLLFLLNRQGSQRFVALPLA